MSEIINFVFASHGRLAEGVKNAAEIILGNADNVSVISAYINNDSDLPKEVQSIINKMEKGGTWVVITDVFGGSVNNEFMQYLNGADFMLISGLNLGMVLELLCMPEKDISIDGIRKIVSNVKENIQLCNDLLEENNEDEHF